VETLISYVTVTQHELLGTYELTGEYSLMEIEGANSPITYLLSLTLSRRKGDTASVDEVELRRVCQDMSHRIDESPQDLFRIIKPLAPLGESYVKDPGGDDLRRMMVSLRERAERLQGEGSTQVFQPETVTEKVRVLTNAARAVLRTGQHQLTKALASQVT